VELLNSTCMPAAYTMGTEPSARESLVVVVKGTFSLPQDGSEPQLLEEQAPLVFADTFTGDPGFSAPVLECDFAPKKRRCDVLLIGSAYAPKGRPTDRLAVGLRVGNLKKSFAVVGPRQWNPGVTLVSAGSPEPFTTQPISYDVAFGGVDKAGEDKMSHHAFMPNPAGRGYFESARRAWGAPMPSTEEIDRPVTTPDGKYRPMSFGPVGRGWEPRYKFGGTYDQNWLDNIFPFLPPDFDERYYQAAPEDQQTDFLRGGEEVVLVNLTPEGKVGFRIPVVDLPMHFFRRRGGRVDVKGTIDTLALEPDARRFTMSWRAQLPLKKNMFEIAQVLVGHKSSGWWRARELGKAYYPSLAEAAVARMPEPEAA
jgi:hypothetical protein